ncbi:hypothetical protein ACHAXT_013091 [Thalassiosira profunda]
MAEDDLLPTITEEDGESVRSGSTSADKDKLPIDKMMAGDKKEKKRRKKREKKDVFSGEDHDTAQQILVDLCTEMKDLKNSMQEGNDATNSAMTSSLESNQKVVQRLTDQMEMLEGNMKQLDQVIESKATPEQIEELARIRAVQEMIKSVTDDKERTVGVYEEHARRGYEEIERLRQDLACERKEVVALRAELEIVRGDRQRMMANGPVPFIGGGDSVGGGSSTGGAPGAKYLNGSNNMSGKKISVGGGDFDDMTLETKGSYDTAAYEMKSLKKRIIHMKKKLTVAQANAKEADDLRGTVENLRIELEMEKKVSKAKDDTIKRLEKEVEELKRAQAGAAKATPRRNSYGKTAATKPAASKTVVTKKKKWWQDF